jgi:hypothetical protein
MLYISYKTFKQDLFRGTHFVVVLIISRNNTVDERLVLPDAFHKRGKTTCTPWLLKVNSVPWPILHRGPLWKQRPFVLQSLGMINHHVDKH